MPEDHSDLTKPLTSMSVTPAIAVRGLDKTYAGSKGKAGKHALKAIDLEIPKGALFGLLGPNGAGKSTLINILAGLVRRSSGEARVWGYDIEKDMRQARLSIGVVPQELNIDPFFTPRELLELQAGLYGVARKNRRTMEILTVLGLKDQADSYARTLSGGMRRRLMVAKAMVHAPPVLVLDEPTAGVDVELRQQLWAEVRRLNAAGTTILLTTHYLEEAEELCDQIAIINHGRVICCEDTKTITKRLDRKEVLLTLDREITEVPAPLATLGGELVGTRQLRFAYKVSDSPLPRILAAVAAEGFLVQDVTTLEGDLEDAFIALTQGTDG